MLNSVPCCFKFLVDSTHILFGITQQQAFHIFSNYHFGLQSFGEVNEIKEQCIKYLLLLAFTKDLFFETVFSQRP